MSCSLCKCPWKWMPKHPGGNQCCSPRRGIRTRRHRGEKSAPRMVNRSISVPCPPPGADPATTAVSGGSAAFIGSGPPRVVAALGARHKARHASRRRPLPLPCRSTSSRFDRGGERPGWVPRGIFLYSGRRTPEGSLPAVCVQASCFGTRMCPAGRVNANVKESLPAASHTVWPR